jgi:polysaccharide export outer membrane protein
MKNELRKKPFTAATWNLIMILSAFLALAGCTPRQAATGSAPLSPPSSSPEIVLGPGDEIEVKFLLWPELNEIQRIRPDGRISLQLIDDVRAGGLTTKQLKHLLEQRYREKIKDPDILILVRELVSQQIYVTGSVNNPGPVPLQGQMTALEAVMAAGGFSKPFVDTIVIYRTTGNRISSTSLQIQDYTGENPSGADPFYVQAKDMIQVQ